MTESGKQIRLLTNSIESIKKRLRCSLHATGLTISASLAMLMMTPLIARCSFLAGILLLADVVVAICCLLTYYGLAAEATT